MAGHPARAAPWFILHRARWPAVGARLVQTLDALKLFGFCR